MENVEMIKDNMTVCFVVLHYMDLENTSCCVDSILMLDEQENIRILLIDNGSSNGSGRILVNRYASFKNVHVLLREDNDGYSKGNNAGIELAKQKWNTDFYVVANNDIEFNKADFFKKIIDLYRIYEFDVLGPDIYAPFYNSHQNPMGKNPPTLFQVEMTIIKNTLMNLLLPLIVKQVIRRHEKGRALEAFDYRKNESDVCLKGACIIYSKKYVNSKDKLFNPETNFYYEEYIQTVYCRKNNKKVVYSPDICVLHKDGAATDYGNVNNYKRCRFVLNNIISSAKIYRNYLLRNE